MLAIKPSESLAAKAAGHARNVVHIGLRDHSLHCGLDVAINKLSFYVRVEDSTEIRRVFRFVGVRNRHFSSLRIVALHNSSPYFSLIGVSFFLDDLRRSEKAR